MSAPFKFRAGTTGAVSSSLPSNSLSLFPPPARQRRPLLFLRRNVRRALKALTMGSAISSIASPLNTTRYSQRPAAPAPNDAESDDEEPQPPTKRRKTRPDETTMVSPLSEEQYRRPFSHVTNESARPLKRPDLVSPSKFYGRNKSSPSGAAIPTKRSFAEFLVGRRKSSNATSSAPLRLPSKPAAFSRCLRADVAGIAPPIPQQNVTNQSHQIECTLSFAIYARNDDDTEFNETVRRVKPCGLKMTYDADGNLHRNFDPPVSLVFVPHEFLVNRKLKRNIQNSDHEYDYEPDLADKYKIEITIQPYGSNKSWPPVSPPENWEKLPEPHSQFFMDLDANEIELMNLSLTTHSSKNLLKANVQTQYPELHLCHRGTRHPLDDHLKLDIQWSLPSHMSVSRNQMVTEQPPAMAEPSAVDDSHPVSTRKEEEQPLPDSPSNSRSQRQRHRPVYNLKQATRLAHGRSPTKRRTQTDSSLVTVTYSNQDSALPEVKPQIKVPGLGCPFPYCRSSHQSINLLIFHLQHEHHDFLFDLRSARGKHYEIDVKMARASSSDNPQKTIQLGKARTAFDFENYCNGDRSWLRSRLGPQDHALLDHSDLGLDSSLSSSSLGSRLSSPNTSHATDDVPDIPSRKSGLMSRLPARPNRRLLVPKTPKPLYDTITKRTLQPGEQIPDSDDEKEESWVVMKHRDIINDYTDLSHGEKEFINRWNPFIMEEHLTHDQQIGESMLRFVSRNKDWLIDATSRQMELNKLCQLLILCDTMTSEERSKCNKILLDAKRQKSIREGKRKVRPVGEDAAAGKNDGAEKPAVRGALSCICLEHTLAHDRVICTGPLRNKCPGRYYHRECAAKSRRDITKKWQCDHCFSLQASA